MKTNLKTSDRPFTLIGRMVVAWNETELVWFLIFTLLVHHLPRAVAEAIFKRSGTGGAQRELIEGVASESLAAAEFTLLLTAIKLAIADTNALAGERNAIVHADYAHVLHGDVNLAQLSDPNTEFSIAISSGAAWRKKMANIFAGKTLETELPKLLKDIQQLISQLDQIRHHLYWRYLPERLRGPPVPAIMDANVRRIIMASDPLSVPPNYDLVWQRLRPRNPA